MNTLFVRGMAWALCAVGLLTACSKIGDTPTHPQKEIADYTIILYGTGGGDMKRNNELDLALYKNLAEVRNTEYTPKVNFTGLVRFSVAVSAMEGIGVTRYDWLPTTLTSTGGMLLEQNNVRPLDFFMTYAPNITDFINEAVETYPAHKYILIAWNHGGGFEPEDVYVPDLDPSTRACMSDYGVVIEGLDAPLKEYLSIFEFEEALRNTNLVKSGGKFEMVYTDMCLMGGAEVVCQLAPYTRYFVGSAHATPGKGGNYRALITALRDCGLDTEKAMKQYIPAAVEDWRSGVEKGENTRELFCYDAKGVLQAAEAFAPIVDRMRAHYAGLSAQERQAFMSQLRSNAYSYGGASPYYDWAHIVRLANYDGKDASMEQLFEKTLTQARVVEYEICCAEKKLPEDMKCGLSIVMCGPTSYQECLNVDGEDMTAYSYQHNYPHTRFDQIAHWSTLLATGAPEDEVVPSHFDLHELGVDGIVDFYSSFSGDCCIELVGNFVFDNPALAELYAREYEAEDLEFEREGNKLKVYFDTLATFYNRYDVSQLIARILNRFKLGPSTSFKHPFATITSSSTICYTAHFLQETCTKCYAEIVLGSPAEASEVASLFGNKTNFDYGFYASDSYVRFDITAEVKGKDRQATLATCADITDKLNKAYTASMQ